MWKLADILIKKNEDVKRNFRVQIWLLWNSQISIFELEIHRCLLIYRQVWKKKTGRHLDQVNERNFRVQIWLLWKWVWNPQISIFRLEIHRCLLIFRYWLDRMKMSKEISACKLDYFRNEIRNLQIYLFLDLKSIDFYWFTDDQEQWRYHKPVQLWIDKKMK